MLLARLINLAETNQISAPLWDQAVITDPGMTNAIYLKQHISTMLSSAFSHVQPYVILRDPCVNSRVDSLLPLQCPNPAVRPAHVRCIGRL